MDKKHLTLALLLLLWFSLVVSSIWFITALHSENRSKLTYERAVEMDKEGILALLKEKEEKSSPISVYFIGAFAVLGVAVGGVSVWFLMEERRRRAVERVREAFLHLFPKEEREVLRLLMEEGEVTQLKVRQQLGLSKVQASRLIQRMERQGLVEVTRSRMNFIRPSPHLRKVLEVLGKE